MTGLPVDPDATVLRTPPRRSIRDWLRRVVDGVLVERVRDGRVRAIGWPAGWGAVLVVAYAAFVVAAVLILVSPLWRTGPMTTTGNVGQLIPVGAVWVLQWLLVVVIAVLHTAAVHGPWWLRVIDLIMIAALMIAWSLVQSVTGFGALTLLSLLAAIGLLVFDLVRMARRPAWWELAVHVALLSVPNLCGLVLRQRFLLLGTDPMPLILGLTVVAMTTIVAPATLASGTALAELAGSLAVQAASVSRRLPRRVLLVAAAVLVAGRTAQAVHDVLAVGVGVDGLARWGPTLVMVALLVGCSVPLLRRAGGSPGVTELPEVLPALALPLGVALVGTAVLDLLAGLVPLVMTGRPHAADVQAEVGALISNGLLLIVQRLLVFVGLLIAAIRFAGRRRTGEALLCAHAALFVLPYPIGALLHLDFGVNPDGTALCLVMFAVALAVGGWHLGRRTLSVDRLVAVGAIVVMSGLFAARQLVLQPFTAVFGPVAPLILVGLLWTLLTGCAAANVDGRRLRALVRAPLVVGNVALAAVILAFYTLAGQPGESVLEGISDLGDSILGTALVTSSVVALLALIRSDAPIVDPDPVHPDMADAGGGPVSAG